MNWQPPPPDQAWRAIELYLSLAYEGPAPLAVRARLDQLRAADPYDFYRNQAFERQPAVDTTRLFLRLGNRYYPHMKLVIERSPDGESALFRADTHDRHIALAPGAPESAAFGELTRKNQELASQIESAWEERGILTFKQYLREDLARRRAGVIAAQ